jgi:hypothetical protein
MSGELSNSKNGTGVSSNGDPIPPSSVTVVFSPSILAVLLAQALALPDWVDQIMRQDEIDDDADDTEDADILSLCYLDVFGGNFFFND